MPSTICLKQRIREALWTSSYLCTNYCILMLESTLLTFGALRAVSNWPGRSAYKVPSFFCKPCLISCTNISRLLRLSVSNAFLGWPNKRCSAWSWHWRHLGAWHFQKELYGIFTSLQAFRAWLWYLGLCPIPYVALCWSSLRQSDCQRIKNLSWSTSERRKLSHGLHQRHHHAKRQGWGQGPVSPLLVWRMQSMALSYLGHSGNAFRTCRALSRHFFESKCK